MMNFLSDDAEIWVEDQKYAPVPKPLMLPLLHPAGTAVKWVALLSSGLFPILQVLLINSDKRKDKLWEK